MRARPGHLWVHGGTSRDRLRVLDGLGLPGWPVPVLDAHRRPRGPYGFGGALLQALVPAALARAPGVVAAHDIEIRAVAPDLRDRVPARRAPLYTRLPDEERILVPAPRRTLRIANGITEFLRDCGVPLRTIVADNVDEADETDRELLQTLARRFDPDHVTIVTCSAKAPPDWFVGRAIKADLSAERESRDLAGRYVASDGILDDPRALAAYHALPPEVRARLHDRRADLLAATGGRSSHLGAIPYHREHGGDPSGAGVEALWAALDHCLGEGFLDAAADYGLRGLALAEPATVRWWNLLQGAATALAGIGRRDEARDLYERARRTSLDPEVHSASAYGAAMLDARHPDPARRDLGRAQGWVNEAIAISTLLPDRAVRAFKLGFDLNGKALIEMRAGRPDQALTLVESAVKLAETDLPPGRHLVHRMILHANRAQLLGVLGHPDEALEDLDTAVAMDPDYPDHHLDRGNLLFQMGRADDALADYDAAIRLSPPLPEGHYNRAQVLLAVGELGRARADLDRVLELDPGYLDAYINRAGLLAELGLDEAARADVTAGLSLAPGNPHLLCVLGQLETAAKAFTRAREAFDAALASSPALVPAWAGRADLRYETGDLDGAVVDLSRAIELDEGAALYFNRAVALDGLGRRDEALADLRRAHELDPGDQDIVTALHRT
ncbi:tetratricopeptide repeat protein [Sphaerisporangium siamense]|uniref:Tetratricopeptide (TPR) repeat protein n=1 Tax=Sphaerisporangium siamense TaxID=795645 RepID=A0A7W7D825_9ACTN|nr:tetratricopeptide repeat protein [Sphaerisporangium siamense]MBB4701987.1 tetratricopeptide (TPR) repeat protein [Sphaerisporangium siamense]